MNVLYRGMVYVVTPAELISFLEQRAAGGSDSLEQFADIGRLALDVTDIGPVHAGVLAATIKGKLRNRGASTPANACDVEARAALIVEAMEDEETDFSAVA